MFWAPNFGAHTGKPASKTPWIYLWSRLISIRDIFAQKILAI